MPSLSLLSGIVNKIREKVRAKLYDYSISLVEIILSVAIGFLIVSVILVVFGYDPGEVISIMIKYGFRDWKYIFKRSTPFIMTALAFSIPSIAGVFNIGGESQLYVGALAGLLVAYYTGNPVLGLLASIAAGAGLGLFIAVLRIYRNINEVITAIMVNWIFYYLIVYLVTGIFYDPKISHQSVSVPESAQLPMVSLFGSLIPSAFILAVAASLVFYYILYHTNTGYLLRVSGLSPSSARYAGYNPRRAVLYSMLLGGAAAGLGGGLLILGISHYIENTMSGLYGQGFMGIGIGLLGRNHPIGIIFAAIFFAGLIIGGQWIEFYTGAPPMLTDAIIGIIVIALSIPYAYRMLINWFRLGSGK